MTNELSIIAMKDITHICTITEEYYSYYGKDAIAERKIRKYLKEHYPFYQVKYNPNNGMTNITIRS